jgi:hypothetical protein
VIELADVLVLAGAGVEQVIGDAIAKFKLEYKMPDTTARHVLERIDEATRETDKFTQWDGSAWEW